ncbi:MAG: tetratricopeptide repeat protein [Bryobacterales bacterium]|nr:tetratricopeptide repeat protein [Bryobacterales bacterium]
MSTFEKLRLAAQAVRQVMPEAKVWSSPESREGESLLDAGKFQEAERCFLRVAGELKSRSAIRPPHGHVLVCLATAQFKLNKFRDAWITADAVRELLTGQKQKPSTPLSGALDLLGRMKAEEGELDEALELFTEALETQKAVLPLDVPAIVGRTCHLAGAMQRKGRLDEAVSMLETVLDQADRSLGKVHPATADCLIQLGECETERGRHATARAHLERALRIHQELNGVESETAIRDLHLLAVAAQAAEDLEAAVGYYETALALRERQLGASATGSAEILMKIAGVQTDMGRYGPAMELLQQAVGKLEGVRDPGLSHALERLGEVYAACGRFEDADVSLRKARRLYEQNPNYYAAALEANTRMLGRIQTYLPKGEQPSIFQEAAMFQPAAEEGMAPSFPPAFSGGSDLGAVLEPGAGISETFSAGISDVPVAHMAPPLPATSPFGPAPSLAPRIPSAPRLAQESQTIPNLWKADPMSEALGLSVLAVPEAPTPNPWTTDQMSEEIALPAFTPSSAPAQSGPRKLQGWDQMTFEYVSLPE